MHRARHLFTRILSGSIMIAAAFVVPIAEAAPTLLDAPIPMTTSHAETASYAVALPDSDQHTDEADDWVTYNDSGSVSASGTEGTASASHSLSVTLSGAPGDLSSVHSTGSGEADTAKSEPDGATTPDSSADVEFGVEFDVTEPGLYSLTGSASAASDDPIQAAATQVGLHGDLDAGGALSILHTACGPSPSCTASVDFADSGPLEPGHYVFFASISATNGTNDAPTHHGEGAYDVVLELIDTANCDITGTANDDVLPGTSGDDVICGLGGNDTIDGGAGNDTILGGSGDDTLNGDDDTDTVAGELGNDTIDGGRGTDTLTGEAGNDHIAGDVGPDTISGGIGNDTIAGGGSADKIKGGDGNDNINAGSGNDRSVDGGLGADVIHGGDGSDGSFTQITFTGGAGEDVVFGDSGNDSIAGGSGSDNLNGGSQPDRVNGQDGNDILAGGSGGAGDQLIGGGGTDRMDGGDGDDGLQGGGGGDKLLGKAGRDCIDGGAGKDVFSGGGGNDKLFAKDGTKDRVAGNAGTDKAKIDRNKDRVTGVENRRFTGTC